MRHENTDSNQIAEAVKRYRETQLKSPGLGLLLAVLLGPLGLFYAGWRTALVLSVVAVLGMATWVVPAACWIGAMMMSVHAVNQHNEKVEAKASLITALT